MANSSMIIKGSSFEFIWLDCDGEGGKFAEWAYHQNHFYHIHTGQRPSKLSGDKHCARCNKEIPALIALAFKLNGGST